MIQQKRKAFFSTRSSSSPSLVRSFPPMGRQTSRRSQTKKTAVARFRPGDLGEPAEAVGVEELRDRAARGTFAEGEPAEPRAALFLRPSLQAIEEAPRPSPPLRVQVSRARPRRERLRRRTDPNPEPAKTSSRRRSRADSSGRACPSRTLPSPRQRECAGTARARRLRPSANSSNTPCSTGSMAAKTSSCVTNDISKSSW